MQGIHTTVSIPWRTVAVMPQPERLSRESEIARERKKVPEPQLKPHALVVDDSEDIALLFAMMLQHAGYDALMTTSPADALKAARREHFDLVISDIGMPEMDGYALAEALRALPDFRTVPMIAVTGFDEYDNRERALAAGFNTHVKKPIDPTSFMGLVETFRAETAH